MNSLSSEWRIDGAGEWSRVTFWHVDRHGRDELLRHMSQAQRVAAEYLESLGWQLYRVDRDYFRHAYMRKDGEWALTLART